MNNQETLNKAQDLQRLKATEVVRNDYVRQQFISVYNAIWKEGGEAAYEREAMYFNQQLREKEPLRQCTGLSVFLAFIDLAVRGLSLEPGAQALCYLLPRGCCVGKDQQGRNVYERHCNLTISGYGELVLRAKAGQILHADNPVIVYEGDEFSFGERDGRKYVNYCCRLPRTSNHIVACFLKITRPDGTVDYSVMTEPDWKRLEAYSASNNSYYDPKTNQRVERANDLYNVGGQIDPGFLRAKCVKHAFKAYPKIAIGKGTQLESDVMGEDGAPAFDPYGGMADAPRDSRMDAAPAPGPQGMDSFARKPDMSAGVTVEPAAESPAGGAADDVF